MGIQIRCVDPATGQVSTIDANTLDQGGAGFGQSSIGPNAFGAKRINISVEDVQRTIHEGRVHGFKPFNLYNSSANNWDSAL